MNLAVRFSPFSSVIVCIVAFAVQATRAAQTNSPKPLAASGVDSVTASGSSALPIFSGDGRFVVFLSHANNLVSNDNRAMYLDIFRHDLVLGGTELISVDQSQTAGGNGDSMHPSVSSNAQLIAFASDASNLVANDTNEARDTFIRSITSGHTVLVSADTNGASPPHPVPYSPHPLSRNIQVSADGRRVVFESLATNLTAQAQGSDTTNVFMRDLPSGPVSLVSISHDGAAPIGPSHSPQMSTEGRYIAFVSTATNLVASGDTNTGGDVYVRDLETGTTHWASPHIRSLLVGMFPATPSGYACFNHSLSSDGKFVVFQARPVPADTRSSNILVVVEVGATNPVLVAADTSPEHLARLSFDGRFVAFTARGNVYRWDRLSGSNAPVSAGTNGAAGNGASHSPVMTLDGKFIAFISKASDFVSDTMSNRFQIFVRDMSAETTRLVTVATNGLPSVASFESSNLAISPNGRLIAFDALATDLVTNDLNFASDVFVRDMTVSETRVISRGAERLSSQTSPDMSGASTASLSADGRIVAFTSYDLPAIEEANRWSDVFVRDLNAGSTRRLSDFSNPVVHFTVVEPLVSGAGSHVAFTLEGVSSAGITFPAVYWRDLDAATNVLVCENAFYPQSVAISSDGTFVVFQTAYALNPNYSDINGGPDVFMRQMPSGPIELVSASHDGTASGSAPSTNAVLSSDDRWVAFLSASTNLLSTNIDLSGPALYLRDLVSNTTHVASIDPDSGSVLAGIRGLAAFSGDSRFVAFADRSYRIIRRDLRAGESKYMAGQGQNPNLSGDGRFVAYEQRGNLNQIYVADARTGIAKLISANLFGTNANGRSWSPLITADARFVVFQSLASDLAENDNNSAADIFVADRIAGTVLLLTMNYLGTGSASGASSIGAMSANGRTLVFQSLAPDLIARDFNDRRDAFVATLSLPDSDGDGMDDDFEITYFGNLGRNGTGDFDGDGQSDYQEFIAGTNPTNDSSILRVISIAAPNSTTRQVLWSAVAGRNYIVQFKDSLLDSWATLPHTIRGTSSTALFVDETSTATRFYRVAALE